MFYSSQLVDSRAATIAAVTVTVATAAASATDDDDNSPRMMCVQEMSTHNKSLLATKNRYSNHVHIR